MAPDTHDLRSNSRELLAWPTEEREGGEKGEAERGKGSERSGGEGGGKEWGEREWERGERGGGEREGEREGERGKEREVNSKIQTPEPLRMFPATSTFSHSLDISKNRKTSVG